MFTYDHDTLPDISAIRLEIGDTTVGQGIRPDGTNFSDEELTVFLTREMTVLGASAAALEAATRLWRRAADVTMGPRSERLSQVAVGLAADAKAMRTRIAEDDAATTADDLGYASVLPLGYVQPTTSEWA